MGGDFNTEPSYREMKPIWDAGFSDVDPFCRWNAGRPDSRCNATHVNAKRKFDYILHRGINSRNCVLGKVNRDHQIVVSDVTTAAGPRVRCSLV